MSTRGAIARWNEDGSWQGRYHHWDSYPTALGKTLWQLCRDHFKRDLKAMLAVLIDEHPAGWSTINDCDFNLEPGYIEDWGKPSPRRPVCYCHGDRNEEEHVVTNQGASNVGVEWAYVFDEKGTMSVLSSEYRSLRCDNPNRVWKIVAEIKLDDDEEPDWKKIEHYETVEA